MALHSRPKIPISLMKPRNAERTGELVEWGNPPSDYPVYRRVKPWVKRSTSQALKDAQGNVITQKQRDGTDRVVRGRVCHTPVLHYANGKPVPENEWGVPQPEPDRDVQENPDAFEEFIVVDAGGGKDELLFNFREDPEVKARKEQEQQRKERLERLLDTLADAELDPDQLADAIAGGKKKGMFK